MYVHLEQRPSKLYLTQTHCAALRTHQYRHQSPAK